MKTTGLSILTVLLFTSSAFAQDSLNIARVGGRFIDPFLVWDLAVSGNYAYTVSWEGGLQVIDISNPAAPRRINTNHVVTSGDAVTVSGSYLYVADGVFGMRIFDITNPENPDAIGRLIVPGEARDVEIADGYAYVVTDSSDFSLDYGSLRVVDISDPSAPIDIGHVDMQSPARGVGIENGIAYVCAFDGLHVMDVSTPSNPVEIGSIGEPWSYYDAVVPNGDYVYVAAGDNGIRVIDVSDPANPVEVGGFWATEWCGSVTLSGGVLWAGFMFGDVLDDNYGEVYILDITDPTTPAQIGSSLDGYRAVVSGSYAYVADLGLNILDITDLSSPVMVGRHPGFPTIGDGAVTGNHVLVPARGTLGIANVNDPGSPSPEIFLNAPTGINVAIQGNHAYVGTGAVFSVIDISDPELPLISAVDTLVGLEQIGRVAVDGNYVCVAEQPSNRVYVIDVTVPANPVLMGSVETDGPRDIAISGDYAYVATHHSGLLVIDLGDPVDPDVIATADLAEYLEAVDVADGVAYVVDESEGLFIVDVTIPEFPLLVGSMDVSDFAVDLEVIGNHVILGDFHNGLQVIDVSDPMHPFLSGYHTDAFGGEGSNLAGLTVAGHLVYTTQGVSLGIYDISAALGASSQPEPLPQSFALYPAYPNPFNPSTTISFDLPQTSPVRLDVFDIQGRLVSTLIDHPLSAGHHVTNVNAESWPSGMYLCRLRSGAFTATQKLLLLK